MRGVFPMVIICSRLYCHAHQPHLMSSEQCDTIIPITSITSITIIVVVVIVIIVIIVIRIMC